jgi:hypothetical protein
MRYCESRPVWTSLTLGEGLDGDDDTGDAAGSAPDDEG